MLIIIPMKIKKTKFVCKNENKTNCVFILNIVKHTCEEIKRKLRTISVAFRINLSHMLSYLFLNIYYFPFCRLMHIIFLQFSWISYYIGTISISRILLIKRYIFSNIFKGNVELYHKYLPNYSFLMKITYAR